MNKLCLIIILLLPLRVRGENITLETLQKAIKDQGAHWTAGKTSISCLPYEEQKALCGCHLDTLQGSEIRSQIPEVRYQKPDIRHLTSLPSEWDWRSQGGYNWMTCIKHQGCGDCWAFGALGAMEALINIYTEAPDYSRNLSEQYLLSCSPYGCNGGEIGGTCEFLKENEIVDEACFTYQADDAIPCGNRCFDWEWRRNKLLDWTGVDSSVEQIKLAIQNGPLYSGMIVYEDFGNYTGGVYEYVSGDVLGGHAIVTLGWNDSDSCWICKNSWGTGWGESGWFRIKWGECWIEQSNAQMIPMDNRYPWLIYVSHELTELTGDGDDVLNPGETALLKVTLYNEPSWAEATNITATLASEDSNIIIADSVATYNDLAPGTTGTNNNEFKFTTKEESILYNIPVSLHITANQGTLPYSTEIKFNIKVTLNQANWPVLLPASVLSSPVVIDMDNDSIDEIIVGGNDGNLYVKSIDGSDKPGFPFSTEGKLESSPAVGDVDGDGKLDIAIGSFDKKVYVIKNDGTLLCAPMVTEGPITATPVLSDLDNDGKLEIIIGSFDKKLYMFRHDGTNFNDGFTCDAPIYAGAAVGDINGDAGKDIVFGALDNKVYAISTDGSLLDGWPFVTGGRITGAPSIANMDGSGTKVVVGSWDKNLYVLNSDGTEAFHIPTNSIIKSSPSFVDLDGDEDLELIFGSNDGNVYAYNHDGAPVDGWPIATGGLVQSSACFSELNKDLTPKVVVGSNDGNLYGRNADGSSIFSMPTGSGILSSPAIADIDGDGDFEIIFGNNAGIQVIDFKSEAGRNNYWNMYRAVPCRTGNYQDIPNTGIEETFNCQLAISNYQLTIYPNPFTAGIRVQWSGISENSRLTPYALRIYDLSGRLVKTLTPNPLSLTTAVEWDGTDEAGNKVASGSYFCQIEVGNECSAKKLIRVR